jgi:hypothetical protein
MRSDPVIVEKAYMDEKRRTRRKETNGKPFISDLNGSLEIISFHNLVRTDYLAKIVNRSIIGLCIETDQPIQPGVVCFKEFYGQTCGVVVWCNQIGSRYRCGIQFISLTRIEEDFLRHQIEKVKPSTAVRDPDRILTKLNGCVPKY